MPITKAAQIIGKISDFVHMYCHVHGLTSEPEKALADGNDLLHRSGFTDIDYLQLCNPMDLQPTENVTTEARLLGAVHLGAVRLIDNIALGDVR